MEKHPSKKTACWPGPQCQQTSGPSWDTPSRGGGSAITEGEYALLTNTAGSKEKKAKALGSKKSALVLWTFAGVDANQMLFEEDPSCRASGLSTSPL